MHERKLQSTLVFNDKSAYYVSWDEVLGLKEVDAAYHQFIVAYLLILL